MNKTIVITGVSKGLGQALAEKFINLGHTIIVCSRSQDAINNLQQQYPQHYFKVLLTLFACCTFSNKKYTRNYR